MRSTEGTRCLDTPENRELVEAKALIIRREIEDKCFDYLKHFPNGNKAHLFRIEPDKPLVLLTVKSYYGRWIKKKPQDTRVRPKRVEDYQSHFHNILAAKIDGVGFGGLYLTSLTHEHLKDLQSYLLTKGLKASSVNAIVHSSLRAMLRDARSDRFMFVDLYNDRALLRPLEIADPDVGSLHPGRKRPDLGRLQEVALLCFCLSPVLDGHEAERSLLSQMG